MSGRLATFSRAGLVGVVAALAVPLQANAASCKSLASLDLPNTTITAASMVAAGGFRVPTGLQANEQGPPQPSLSRTGPEKLPAFCRIQLTVLPAIKIEVWMPASNWNGNFEAVGNGGKAGSITYAAMATALKDGYATASTDTGHEGSGADAKWASDHPDLIADFAYLAIHDMTVTAQKVVAAYYDKDAKYSFFNGCSTGGRQGLMEAQRYPQDYNGILAGDPVIDYTHLQASHLSLIALRPRQVPGSFFPSSILPTIQKASLAACEGIAGDGVHDGLIEDPLECGFWKNPAALRCQGPQARDCLNGPQFETLKEIYGGTRDPLGHMVYPGFMPGHETGWTAFLGSADPSKQFRDQFGSIAFFADFVFDNPNWDFLTWDYAKDLPFADQKLASDTDTNPDLGAYRARGGKLLLYHGWTDPLVSPLETLDYYDRMVATLSRQEADAPGHETPAFINSIQKTQDFARLFMVPGMDHCGGGPGPNMFDAFGSLVNWVEHDQAPREIIGSHIDHGTVTFTRPLCPYPMIAQYTGHGSTREAANFACGLPKE